MSAKPETDAGPGAPHPGDFGPGPGQRPGLTLSSLILSYPGHPPILTIASLTLPAAATLAITGPSGAGKTTLLHALAGIERPASGTVHWGGTDLWALTPRQRDQWRREQLGLVFQDMHLLDGLTALANVLLPARFDHVRVPAALQAHARDLLDRLGVPPDRRTTVMSRGERQRTAIARALLRRPTVLIADEPTASLDAATAETVGALLVDAAAEAAATLIVATHDPALQARMHHHFAVRTGHLQPVP